MHFSGSHLNLWFEAEDGTAQAEGASYLQAMRRAAIRIP